MTVKERSGLMVLSSRREVRCVVVDRKSNFLLLLLLLL